MKGRTRIPLAVVVTVAPLAVVVTVALLALTFAASASADNIPVNTTADTVAVDPAVSCVDSSGDCSLRSAIQRANVIGGTNTITLAANSTYKITIDPITAMTDDDSAGDFNIENGDTLTINGAGFGSTTIDANDLDRAFEIDSQSSLTLTGVTVKNGLPLNPRPSPATTSSCPSSPPQNQGDGGGILNNGNLELDNDVITANLSSGPGGGVAQEDVGDLLISHTTISHNVVCPSPGDGFPGFGPGGGVYDEDGFGSDLIDSSTIIDNTTAQDFGGGVADQGGGNFTITNTTISGNTASEGGGIETEGGEGPGSLTLVGDTISGNTATAGGFEAPGGGIENDGVDVSITNTTITGNTASDGGAIASGDGSTTTSFVTITGNTATGESEIPLARRAPLARRPEAPGVFGDSVGNLQNLDSGNFTLDNTIVAQGHAPSGDPTNCGGGVGGFTSNGFNLFDDNGTGCSAISTDLINSPPLLGALANNGGPTETEAVTLQSPALNAANPGAGVCTSETNSIDQRGVTRPQGPGCDIGAFELQYADMQVTAAAAPSTINVGQQATFTDTVTNAGPSTADNVTFTDPAAAGHTINSVSATKGTCTHTSTTVSCSLGTVNNGQAITITITVTGTSAGKLTLNSSVGSPTPDPNLNNNHASASVNVVGKADLAIKKQASPSAVILGKTVTYTLSATNKGPQTDTSVKVTDKLPSGVSFVSDKGHDCSGKTKITCSLGTMRKGAHATITVTVKTTHTGSIKNTATITGKLPDPNLKNNKSSASISVSSPPLGVCAQRVPFVTHFDQEVHEGIPQDRVTTIKVYIDGKLTETRHGHDIRQILVSKISAKGRHTITVWFIFATGQIVTETRMVNHCSAGPPSYSYPPTTNPGAS
jgi:uncharacterized repeat protein (TIGR01451 family)/CSLREA domain-containing protein